MEPDDILLLENHNKRFANYDQLSRIEKLLLIEETAIALGSVLEMKKGTDTMDGLKNYVKRLPDIKLIHEDIDRKIRVLQENNVEM